MATLNAGQSTTITLLAGYALELVGDGSFVNLSSLDKTPISFFGSKSMGPFPYASSLSISASSSVDYNLSAKFQSDKMLHFDTEEQRVSATGFQADSINTICRVAKTGGIYSLVSVSPVIWQPMGAKLTKSTVTWLPVIPTSHITSGTRTGHLTTSAPSGFTGVQLIFPNPGASVAITSAAVAVTEDLASPIIPKIGGTQYNALAGSGDQLGWVPVTFNGGSAGATMAAGTPIAPSYLVSDIVPISAIPRTDGGKFSLIMARFYYSATTFPTRAANANGQNELNNVAAPYTYISLLQSTDGVSTPSNFTSTTPNNNLCAIGFIFHTATGGKTVVLCGDSIMSGGSQSDTDIAKANNILSSWGFLAVRQAATQLGAFIGVSQAALGGATPNEYYARFLAQLSAGIQPSLVLYPPWSPNGDGGVFPPAGRVNENTWHYRAAQVIARSKADSFNCLFSTPTPYEAWGDYVREGARAKIKTYAAGSIDFNEILYNAAGSGDNKWKPEYRFDAAHPNDAGHAAMAAYAVRFIIEELGL